jgi:hypothetical protein
MRSTVAGQYLLMLQGVSRESAGMSHIMLQCCLLQACGPFSVHVCTCGAAFCGSVVDGVVLLASMAAGLCCDAVMLPPPALLYCPFDWHNPC